jgi:hypothetical protein
MHSVKLAIRLCSEFGGMVARLELSNGPGLKPLLLGDVSGG